MAGIWDDIKKSVGGFASKAAEKAGEFTREAAEKAEEMTQLGKVKLDLFQIKRDIEKKYTELGIMVYGLLKKAKKPNISGNEKVIKLVEDLKNLEKQVKEKEAHYQKIRSTVKEDDDTTPTAPAESKTAKKA